MLHGAVLLEFCQAFGHLAPFKKQIEVGTGWGWKWQSREQSRCWLFFKELVSLHLPKSNHFYRLLYMFYVCWMVFPNDMHTFIKSFWSYQLFSFQMVMFLRFQKTRAGRLQERCRGPLPRSTACGSCSSQYMALLLGVRRRDSDEQQQQRRQQQERKHTHSLATIERSQERRVIIR